MSDSGHLPIPDLAQAHRDYLVRAYKVYPVHTNRASQIGHDCPRYLTYLRRNWQDMALPDVALMSIFREGGTHEKAVLHVLAEMGYRVVESQRAFHDDTHQISGAIDGQLLVDVNGETHGIPFDAKSMSSYTWDSLNTYEDLIHHKLMYVRMWRSQLVMYCYLMAKPMALIVAKNKSTGLLKTIQVPLDYGHAEELLQKADLVNRHVQAGTLPDRMPYSEDVCGSCPAFSLCLPDEALRGGIQLLDDPALLEQIRRRLDLEPQAREFDRLDKQIKDRCKQAFADEGGTAEAVVGTEFLVRVSQQNRKGYEVAPGVVTTVKIQRLGKANSEGREEVA